MADIEEIQEYLWKNLIFHDYSLHHTQGKQMVIPEVCRGNVLYCLEYTSVYISDTVPEGKILIRVFSAREPWEPSSSHALKGFQEV